MTIVIEKGVALPQACAQGRKDQYPFADMVVGDSFFVPCEKEKSEKIRTSIKNCARYKNNKKITTRVVDGGVRAWCVSINKEVK